MDIGAIRTALKNAIDTIDNLAVQDLNDNPEAPGAIVYPKAPYSVPLTFDDSVQLQFCVLLLVPYVDTGSAQENLDAFLGDEGPTSVRAAIEADQTLAGNVADAVITEVASYGVISLMDGGDRYLSAELVVDVWT